MGENTEQIRQMLINELSELENTCNSCYSELCELCNITRRKNNIRRVLSC